MRKKSINPAVYGLTSEDVDRIIRIHTMCKDMDEEAFEQVEFAARSIALVNRLNSMKKLRAIPSDVL